MQSTTIAELISWTQIRVRTILLPHPILISSHLYSEVSPCCLSILVALIPNVQQPLFALGGGRNG